MRAQRACPPQLFKQKNRVGTRREGAPLGPPYGALFAGDDDRESWLRPLV
jgi:hypothetical protein